MENPHRERRIAGEMSKEMSRHEQLHARIQDAESALTQTELELLAKRNEIREREQELAGIRELLRSEGIGGRIEAFREEERLLENELHLLRGIERHLLAEWRVRRGTQQDLLDERDRRLLDFPTDNPQ